MAGHQGVSLTQLARFAGIGEARTSTRLTKLAERGLTVSPQCVPGRAWALTAQGRAVVLAGRPLLDDLDRDILRALALTGMGVMKLSRRLGTCPLTVKRQLGLLTARGLAFADPRRFYVATDAGREALGPDAAKPTPRWVIPEAVAASTARDVVNRPYVNDITSAQRSNCGKLARAAAKRNKSSPSMAAATSSGWRGDLPPAWPAGRGCGRLSAVRKPVSGSAGVRQRPARREGF